MLVVAVLSVLFILVYIYGKYRYSPSEDDPPGLKPQILFGNLINTGILSGKKAFHEVLSEFQHRFGDIFQFWLASHRCIVFCQLEHVEVILRNRHIFELSPLGLPNFDLMIPNGISMVYGEHWKRHAKVLVPLFKRANICHNFPEVMRLIDRFIVHKFRAEGVHSNLAENCKLLALNLSGLTTLECDFNTETDSSIKNAFTQYYSCGSLFFMLPWAPRWMWKIFLRLNRKYQQANRLIRKRIEDIFDQALVNENTKQHGERRTVIGSLVASLNEETHAKQMSRGLTRSEIIDNLLLLIIAGSETSAGILAWFIFYASKNYSVQENIRDELRRHSLLVDDGIEHTAPLTLEKLSSLIYCECVLKEVS